MAPDDMYKPRFRVQGAQSRFVVIDQWDPESTPFGPYDSLGDAHWTARRLNRLGHGSGLGRLAWIVLGGIVLALLLVCVTHRPASENAIIHQEQAT